MRGAAMWILLANKYGRPVWVASVITGTSPAHDTRCSLSNTTESTVPMGNQHRQHPSELLRLMLKEHQSSQLRVHFPHSDTR